MWKVTVCLEEMMLSTLRTFLDARIQSLDVSQGLENYGKALVRKEVIIGEKCRAKLKTVYPILRYKERAGEEDQVRNDHWSSLWGKYDRKKGKLGTHLTPQNCNH